MRIGAEEYRTIWPDDGGGRVSIIDQTRLPHELVIAGLESPEDAARAIATMQVRGAPLIGATAAYGLALAMRLDPSDAALGIAADLLGAARPTAVNLRWAVEEMRSHLSPLPPADREAAAFARAGEIVEEDVAICRAIGEAGLPLITAVAEQKRGAPVNVLTHCNAGWLATIEWGTATAPVYLAHRAGIPVHVWVDETRPRNQGAALTAYELGHEGVPHTVIADNVGGHLMQRGEVDLCLVGTDRTTGRGDVCNKIGTYLKALAAQDNGVPFYVALPGPTIDWRTEDGGDIPIEERDGGELRQITGRTADGTLATVDVVAEGSPVANYAFDVTPARLVTGLITERGIANASADGLLALYPERAQ